MKRLACFAIILSLMTGLYSAFLGPDDVAKSVEITNLEKKNVTGTLYKGMSSAGYSLMVPENFEKVSSPLSYDKYSLQLSDEEAISVTVRKTDQKVGVSDITELIPDYKAVVPEGDVCLSTGHIKLPDDKQIALFIECSSITEAGEPTEYHFYYEAYIIQNKALISIRFDVSGPEEQRTRDLYRQYRQLFFGILKTYHPSNSPLADMMQLMISYGKEIQEILVILEALLLATIIMRVICRRAVRKSTAFFISLGFAVCAALTAIYYFNAEGLVVPVSVFSLTYLVLTFGKGISGRQLNELNDCLNRQQRIINDLEKEISEKQVVISAQDNRIKNLQKRISDMEETINILSSGSANVFSVYEELFGLSGRYSRSELDKAVKESRFIVHPDRAGEDKAQRATIMSQFISTAYEKLMTRCSK